MHSKKIWPNIQLVFSTANDKPCESLNSTDLPINLHHLETNEIEEADIRIIMHIDHAIGASFNNIIVLSTDTDVLVLLVYYWNHFYLHGL